MRKPIESQYKNLTVGITGSIGAGKSTVGKIIQGLGYTVLSADQIAREVTTSDQRCLQEIRHAFGPSAFQADGSLDRRYLRDKISNSLELKKILESITHPRIREIAQAKIQAHFNQGERILFYEAPVLFEAKLENQVDLILCVIAPDETRMRRIMQRDGLSSEQASQFFKAQLPQQEKARNSHFLIENDGNPHLLEPMVKKILGNLSGLLSPTSPSSTK